MAMVITVALIINMAMLARLTARWLGVVKRLEARDLAG